MLEDANAPNPPGSGVIDTPIGVAVRNGRADIIKILAPLSTNPNTPCRGWTQIYRATVIGDIEVIRALIPWTENPNAPNPAGGTPITSAGLCGHTEIVELLRPFVPYHRNVCAKFLSKIISCITF